MTKTPSKAEQLLSVLSLELIDTNLFRGQNEYRQDGMRLFGGQVLAQALTAATNTTDNDRHIHSLHGYFLRPGDARVPVLYSVDRIRDGRSFTTRRVVGTQNGESIFSMSTSFHVAETGFSHQTDMPDVPRPDDLEDDHLVSARVHNIENLASRWSTRERPFAIRSTYPLDQPRPDNINNPIWIRFKHDLPDDRNLHCALLAYASDMGFVSTSSLPHRETVTRASLQMASLDHAIWFHRPCRMDEWILYCKSTPSSASSRGFNQGTFYSLDGKIIASSMQEGLMRVR